MKFTAVIGIKPISNEVPSTYKLYNNYPNPFNPSTKIKFSILKEGEVTLKIYNIAGNEEATLIKERLDPGTYETQWDAKDFSSGVYFYKLTSGNFVDTKKMVLIR